MSGNAYQNQPFSEPPKRSNNWWIFALLGGGFLLMMLVCCGGGLGLVGFGMNIVEEELKTQLRDNPEVRQHLGEITEFDMNFVKSSALDEDDVFVYDVKGSKGEAELTIDSESLGDGSVIRSVVMRLSTGEEIEIDFADASEEALNETPDVDTGP